MIPTNVWFWQNLVTLLHSRFYFKSDIQERISYNKFSLPEPMQAFILKILNMTIFMHFLKTYPTANVSVCNFEIKLKNRFFFLTLCLTFNNHKTNYYEKQLMEKH